MLAPKAENRRDLRRNATSTSPAVKLPVLTPTGEGIAFQLSTRTGDGDTAAEQEADAAATAVVDGESTDEEFAPPFGVIIDDEQPLVPGQIHRTQFVETISAEIERVADEELAATGSAARDCPYLAHWLRYYRERPAVQIERAIRRYARPENTDLEGLREAILTRVRTAVQAWIRTGGREFQAPENIRGFELNDRTPEVSAGSDVQRKAVDPSGSGAPSSHDPGTVRAQLGNGESFAGGVRSRMEHGFGRSFAGVQFHTDARAVRLASSLSARAFTVGSHVAFGAGQYRPGTPAGDFLIAHELAHTVQQQRGVAKPAESTLEEDADDAAIRLLKGERPSVTASSGLRLSRCIISDSSTAVPPVGTPEEQLADYLRRQLDDNARASSLSSYMAGSSAAVRAEAMRLLRLRPHAHGSYYRLMVERLATELAGPDRETALGLVDAGQSIGPGDLNPAARGIFELFSNQLLVTAASRSQIDSLLQAVQGAAPSDLAAALRGLHREPETRYGSRLNALQAYVRRDGTPQQYREFVARLHSAGVARVLSDADPVVNLEVEREGTLNRQGGTSALTDEQLAGLFEVRAMEAVQIMLRDSEHQLIGVLTRSQGAGGTSTELDADADAALQVVNGYLRAPARIETFETFAARVRAAGGRPSTDEELRPVYNRQRQIELYQVGALVDREIVRLLTDVQGQISDHQTWFGRTHVVMGPNPVSDALAGPARAYQDALRLQEEGAQRNRELAKLRPIRDTLTSHRNRVEGVLPLLGGLDQAGLTNLANLRGGASQFDQILEQQLGRIFANIEEARRMLRAGEVSVWLLPPIVSATRGALRIDDPPANDAQRRWARIIDSRMAAAVSERESVHKVLEVLNAGALIGAIGLAVFTGGGSLALYAGVVGTGLALGTSIYDVVDATRRAHQAEAAYGSGLTAGTRLSDVPPDYQGIHAAWVSLGINVLLSVLFLRSAGPQLNSSLRGEEAAVRAATRRIARQLRAMGATATEEEIVEATIRVLRREGRIAGGTQGGITTLDVNLGREEWRTGASLETQVATLTGESRLGGATLAARGAPLATTASAPSVFRIEIPHSLGPVEVRLSVQPLPVTSLPPGADTSSIRLLMRPLREGVFEATLYIDQQLSEIALAPTTTVAITRIRQIIQSIGPRGTANEVARQLNRSPWTVSVPQLLDASATPWTAGTVGNLESRLGPAVANAGRDAGLRVTALRGPSGWDMRLTRADGSIAQVEVEFRSVAEADLPPGPHGRASGPTRYVLTPTGGGNFRATVYVHRGLRPEAFAGKVGHELDEIAFIVHASSPAMTAAAIEAEQLPRIFRPGAIASGTAPSGHDFAQARELSRLIDEMRGSRDLIRSQRVQYALQDMGFTDLTSLEARVNAFGAAPGVSANARAWVISDMPQRFAAQRAFATFTTAPAVARTAAARAGGTVIISEDAVEHMMFPQARTGSSFVADGLGGGHVEANLRSWLARNPTYAVVETTPAARASSGFHRYEQWHYTGAPGTEPPIGALNRPGGTGFNPTAPGYWVRSSMVKTTVEDIQVLLQQGEDAFNQWRLADRVRALDDSVAFGRGIAPPQSAGAPAGTAAPRVPAISERGIEFGGFFDYVPPSTNAPAYWRIRTLFIESSWF